MLLIICIFVLWSHSRAFSIVDQSSHGCAEINKEYPFPDQPANAVGSRLTRAQLAVDSAIQVTVSERVVPPDNDNYDTEVVVTIGGKRRVYEVPKLIPGGRGLRLLRARVICKEGAPKVLVLGLESGWTGARQAFVVISFSGDTFNAVGTKLLHQGRFVLNEAHPDHFELWSASPQDDGLCGACAKHYVVYDCKTNRGSANCSQRSHLTGPPEPNAVTGELIEVH